MRHPHRRRLIVALIGVAAPALVGAPPARAEPTADDKAVATILFQEGRSLMAAGRVPEACQKLEESQRLDPGGGTMLNLALCHEQEGRLARAWSEFQAAQAMARHDGRADRETEAGTHVRDLEPRLSRLTIVVPAGTQVEGLAVERDGHEVGRGAWATAIPVDGGQHVVRATAPGREPFSTTIAIGRELDARTIEIPVLATPVVVVAPAPVTESAAAAPTSTPARLRWSGIATAGAGVLVLGAAGVALAAALKSKEASNADCYADGCGSLGLQKREEATSRGTLATVLGVGGVVLVGTGVALYVLGRRSPQTRETARATRVTIDVAPNAALIAIGGGF